MGNYTQNEWRRSHHLCLDFIQVLVLCPVPTAIGQHLVYHFHITVISLNIARVRLEQGLVATFWEKIHSKRVEKM
jgi:hypothetical protein